MFKYLLSGLVCLIAMNHSILFSQDIVLEKMWEDDIYPVFRTYSAHTSVSDGYKKAIDLYHIPVGGKSRPNMYLHKGAEGKADFFRVKAPCKGKVYILLVDVTDLGNGNFKDITTNEIRQLSTLEIRQPFTLNERRIDMELILVSDNFYLNFVHLKIDKQYFTSGVDDGLKSFVEKNKDNFKKMTRKPIFSKEVSAGELLGETSNYGLASYKHLHLMVYEGKFDPLIGIIPKKLVPLDGVSININNKKYKLIDSELELKVETGNVNFYGKDFYYYPSIPHYQNGDKVTINSSWEGTGDVNIREFQNDGSFKIVDKKKDGVKGIIISEKPKGVLLDKGKGYLFYKVRFNDGKEGWVAGIYLDKERN